MSVPFDRVLVPGLALAAKLSARVELEEGGGEEVEIRAATVYIADRIVQRLPGVLGALGAIGGVAWFWLPAAAELRAVRACATRANGGTAGLFPVAKSGGGGCGGKLGR